MAEKSNIINGFNIACFLAIILLESGTYSAKTISLLTHTIVLSKWFYNVEYLIDMALFRLFLIEF